jgi:hypothetical protein
MTKLQKLFLRIFPRYERLEFRAVSYREGNLLIQRSVGKPETEQWVLAKEEDNNRVIGLVMLERRQRIL